MKKLLIVCILLMAIQAQAQQTIWVKVVSNDVNNVWFKRDKSYTGQQLDRQTLKNYPNSKYWKLVGGTITLKGAADIAIADLPDKYKKTDGTGKWVEKNQAEKDAADAAELTAQVDYQNWEHLQRRFIKLMVKEINTLRAQHGLPPRTKQQVMDALKQE